MFHFSSIGTLRSVYKLRYGTPRQGCCAPMARGSLVLAANQGLLYVLAMAVIGGLVGAGALGYDVVLGFSRSEEWGKGMVMGYEEERMTVLFDDVGYKTLSVPVVKEHALLKGLR